MKTFLIIILGLIVIGGLVFMILVKILELTIGAILILLAVIVLYWLYNKVKDKID